jgi:hypothetical protein
VPRKKRDQLATLSEIVSPVNGYAAYRKALDAASSRTALPFQV